MASGLFRPFSEVWGCMYVLEVYTQFFLDINMYKTDCALDGAFSSMLNYLGKYSSKCLMTWP